MRVFAAFLIGCLWATGGTVVGVVLGAVIGSDAPIIPLIVITFLIGFLGVLGKTDGKTSTGEALGAPDSFSDRGRPDDAADVGGPE